VRVVQALYERSLHAETVTQLRGQGYRPGGHGSIPTESQGTCPAGCVPLLVSVRGEQARRSDRYLK
jgi:hypothetical protein